MSKQSDWEFIAIVASLVSAVAAVIVALISLWQGFQNRDSIAIALAQTRPYLLFDHPGTLPDLSRVTFGIKNTGAVSARVVHKETRTWVDTESRAADHGHIDIVAPGEVHVTFTTHLSGDLPDRVRTGKSDLRYGMCVLYEATTIGDSRRWITDAWVVFNPRGNAFSVRKRDEVQADGSPSRCDLEALMPQDWVTWKPLTRSD